MELIIKDVLALLPGGAEKVTITVGGGVIRKIGEAPEDAGSAAVIDGHGRLAVPGLVNAHTHAYMTALRGHADDLPFTKWLFERVMPAEESLTPGEARWSASLACLQMLRGGVTAFCDMHMYPGSSCRAALEMGMRAVVARGLSGGADDPAGGARRLREAREEIAEYGGHVLLSFMLGPHAVYTCDEGYLREIADLARELGVGVCSHMAESRNEIADTCERYGVTPFGLYDRCGLLGSRMVAVHCVHMTEGDIALVGERGVSVALNPASNLKLANGFAPVPELLRAGVNLCLGTDSAASNNSLSVLRELGLVSLLYKGLSGDPTLVTAGEGFKMATVNGARALGLHNVGELREGWAADIAIFNTDVPELTPLREPAAALAYASAGLTAETVIVNGELALYKGEFVKADADRIRYETNRIADRLREDFS